MSDTAVATKRKPVYLFKNPRDGNYIYVSVEEGKTLEESAMAYIGRDLDRLMELAGVKVFIPGVFSRIYINFPPYQILVSFGTGQALMDNKELEVLAVGLFKTEEYQENGVKYARLVQTNVDWTVDLETGRKDGSQEFVKLVDAIHQIIYNNASDLITGTGRKTALEIVSTLAHQYGLVPKERLIR